MKPILFNTEMVRAILEGRKTVTRRVINRNIVNGCDMESDGTLLNYENSYGDFINPVDLCRYRTGDVLYVRETWAEGATGYVYKASNEPVRVGGWKIEHRWKPSIHMPKAAARIFLKVTGVRVERLQDMDTADDQEFFKEGTADKHSFIELWNSTVKNESQGWYGNPYVWVIEFERVAVDGLW